MCIKLYNLTQRVAMSLDDSLVIFLVSWDAIYEMLLLPNNQTLIDEEALVLDFNSLSVEQKECLLVRFLPEKTDIPEMTFPFLENMFLYLSREIITMSILIPGYDGDGKIDE
jgi:hypothetical protein